MKNSNNRYKIWVKIIAIVIVCLFLVNDIIWADPKSFVSARSDTLAVESRFKPFSEKHGLNFQNTVKVALIATKLKGFVASGN